MGFAFPYMIFHENVLRYSRYVFNHGGGRGTDKIMLNRRRGLTDFRVERGRGTDRRERNRQRRMGQIEERGTDRGEWDR